MPGDSRTSSHSALLNIVMRLVLISEEFEKSSENDISPERMDGVRMVIETVWNREDGRGRRHNSSEKVTHCVF